MAMFRSWVRVVLGATLLLAQSALALTPVSTPPTLRVDLVHGGNATTEHYSLERVVEEPGLWPGNPAKPLDTSNRGQNRFEVIDARTGALLYSRSYSTVFDEWQSTEEAGRLSRAFQESLRFPRPSGPVKLKVYGRDAGNAFVEAWSVDIDPFALDVVRATMPAPAQPVAIRDNGPSSTRVDLLILGDGYTADEQAKFIADARRLSDHLFSVSPFRERAQDFNVWALSVPTPRSGVSRPSTQRHHATALGTRYDIFGSERYVLTLDNRALREVAQHAPYEFIEILVNDETYGGGGIYGQFSTAAASNEWADYLFVHEFGHHFAGLADEYYTSPVAYQSGGERPEPWEPNATANTDRATLKWGKHVAADTALPTAWPKAEFEAYQRDYQAKRAKLRADRRPEAEMNALFRAEREFTEGLFSAVPTRDVVGLFEGANYQATGYYRPQLQCTMFTRSERFCRVCAEAIGEVIDLYAK